MTKKVPTNAVAPANSAFSIETGIPVPVAKRGGGAGSVYPFDALEVDQSFHVAPTVKRPKPAKALASTVSGATSRYAVPEKPAKTRVNKVGKTVPVMTKTREFVIRSVGKDDPKGEGARIFRVK